MLVLSIAGVVLAACLAAAAPGASNSKGPSEGAGQAMEQRYEPAGSELDNLIMRPALYDEAPLALEGYESRRRKRGSGTKVGGAGAATKVATKAGSGKKNLKAPAPDQGRQKRDSGLSAADVRTLLSMWEAQEQRRKAEWNNQLADRYYGRAGADQDENGDIWYNEPVVVDAQRDMPHSYFSEQNRLALSRYPDVESELAQRYEEARRKRQYIAGSRMKRFMVSKKRSEGPRQSYRSRDDLYTLAELLRAPPRVGQDLPVYRRLVF